MLLLLLLPMLHHNSTETLNLLMCYLRFNMLIERGKTRISSVCALYVFSVNKIGN